MAITTRSLIVVFTVAIATSVCCTTDLDANPIAYWRFEAGPAGSPVIDGGTPAWPNYDPDVADSSGNGNELAMWETGGAAGFAYRSDVPASTLKQTKAANNFSIKNTGGFPASFTDPAGPLNSITPSAFTIEASWKPENGGFRTVVGRDAQNVTGTDTNLAALYLQAVPGDALAIKFVDEAGFWHVAQSAPGVVQGFDFGTDPEGTTGVWHNLAAVSDGSTLSLYLDKGAGFSLVAQTDLTLSGSTNTALTDGSTSFGGTPSGADWAAGDWSVARGLYGGGHTDRAYGFIDEVRISDMALTPDQFLFAPIPEPSSFALITLGLLSISMIGRRRRNR